MTAAAEEGQRRCFDPFFTTRRAQGLGLGLYIVHNLVTLAVEITLRLRFGKRHEALTLSPCSPPARQTGNSAGAQHIVDGVAVARGAVPRGPVAIIDRLPLLPPAPMPRRAAAGTRGTEREKSVGWKILLTLPDERFLRGGAARPMGGEFRAVHFAEVRLVDL